MKTKPLAGRQFEANRYGFNNQEKLSEINNIEGGYCSFKYREYNTLLGKFISVDPLWSKYPWNSGYAFAENRVIDGTDLEGKEFESAGKLTERGWSNATDESSRRGSVPAIAIEAISGNATSKLNTKINPFSGADKNSVSTAISIVEVGAYPLTKAIGNESRAGSNLGSNLKTYTKTANGGIFKGNQYTKTIPYSTINKAVKVGSGALNAVSIMSDYADLRSGATGTSEFMYNVSKTAAGIANPAVGAGLLLLDQTKAGKELNTMIENIDKRIKERELKQDNRNTEQKLVPGK